MSGKKPFVILIAGPNGSGKTSLTRQILSHNWALDAEYINPDEIAQKELGNWNDPSKILIAAELAENRRNTAVQERRNFVFETVFSAPDKISFLLSCLEKGYFIRFFFISTQDPMINAQRVNQRILEGGHSVPFEKIISRYTKSIANCIRISSSVDRLYLIDNSYDGKSPQILFRAEKGIIAKQYSNIPNWAKPIWDQLLPPNPPS